MISTELKFIVVAQAGKAYFSRHDTDNCINKLITKKNSK